MSEGVFMEFGRGGEIHPDLEVLANEQLDKLLEKENVVGTTDDPTDSRLGRGVDEKPAEMNEVYLVLSEEERAKGFVRPYRNNYVHAKCGVETIMGSAIAETYARQPYFYGATYCISCRMHLPVSEFYWDDGTAVGS